MIFLIQGQYHYWQKVITLFAQQLYYIIGKLLRYWLYYIKIIMILPFITLLAVNTILVATRHT